jgi:hypothetical protein
MKHAARAALALILAALLSPSAWAQSMMPPGTPATPGTACGAEGVGLDPLSRAVVRGAYPGQRVDERGNWVQCNRPCIGDSKPREWMANGNTCTTASARGYSGVDDQRLNRVLLHGTYGVWRQGDGPTMGVLVERCDDGVRTVAHSSCVQVAAEPVAPASAAPPASAPTPVAAPGCGRATVRRDGLTAVYAGPRLPEGASAVVRLGARDVRVWCRNGRLV